MSVLAVKSPVAPLSGLVALVAEAFRLFAAASAAANAVENHRKPEAGDLRTLGIAPETFTVRL